MKRSSHGGPSHSGLGPAAAAEPGPCPLGARGASPGAGGLSEHPHCADGGRCSPLQAPYRARPHPPRPLPTAAAAQAFLCLPALPLVQEAAFPRVQRDILQVEQYSQKLRSRTARKDATAETLEASRLLAHEGLNPRKLTQVGGHFRTSTVQSGNWPLLDCWCDVQAAKLAHHKVQGCSRDAAMLAQVAPALQEHESPCKVPFLPCFAAARRRCRRLSCGPHTRMCSRWRRPRWRSTCSRWGELLGQSGGRGEVRCGLAGPRWQGDNQLGARVVD